MAYSLRHSIDCIPVELLLGTFELLDARTLMLAQGVCRQWHDIIAHDSGLQYKIELELSGIKDEAETKLPKAEQLRLLRSHQSAWRDLSQGHIAIDTVEQSILTNRRLNRGVFFHIKTGDGSGTRTFYCLPSRRRQTGSESWVVNLETYQRVDDYDPSQDLLLVGEYAPTASSGPDYTRIHIRSLKTGGSHNASTLETLIIEHPHRRPEQITYDIQIAHDFVGVLVHDDGLNFWHEKPFTVWNWKSGEKLLEIRAHDIDSFAFLSDEHVVLLTLTIDATDPGRGSRTAALYVHSFAKHVDQPVLTAQSSYDCAFLLPTAIAPLAQGILHSDPDICPHLTDKGEALSDSLIVAGLVLGETHGPILVVYIPASNLLKHLRSISDNAQGQIVEWDAWGPSGTFVDYQWSPGDSPFPVQPNISFIKGMRCIDLTRSPWAEDGLSILDFDQRRLKREDSRNHDRGKHSTADGIVLQPPEVPAALCWNSEGIRTSLRHTRTTFAIDDLRWWSEVQRCDRMLCDDAVMLFIKVCSSSVRRGRSPMLTYRPIQRDREPGCPRTVIEL
ncbi:hypothetical protein EVG20_g11504 [Dentipellis fragilis]|uniref:F-box domain-containing protein n=1 Tax=Dentipellis fragilis TaxID=205917 RepID=A0A4Y9XKH6_9AGAM|nr:hypothetical protein EVG20_g11504 [Dentipellis fragilis]